jgi:hypothetical protein
MCNGHSNKVVGNKEGNGKSSKSNDDGNEEGNGNGDKSNGNGIGNKEGNGNGPGG